MTRHIPTNTDDVIDSRDIIERIEELQELETAIADARAELDNAGDDTEREKLGAALDKALAAMDDADREELETLRKLASEAEGYAADWRYGETLIRDSYFKTYAMELADDIGAIDAKAGWPLTCIDWDQAARELQMDYTAVDFDGVTYWIR